MAEVWAALCVQSRTCDFVPHGYEKAILDTNVELVKDSCYN